MAPTKVIQSHREPAHPAVIPWGFREGEGLAPLALIAQTTRAVMAFHHAGIDMPVAQQGQDVLEPRFAIESTHFDPLDPPLLIVFFHLPLGQALWPAEDRTRRSALRLETRQRVAPSKGLQERCLIAHVGIGKDRWQMPRTETSLGVMPQGPGRPRASVRPCIRKWTNSRTASCSVYSSLSAPRSLCKT